MAETVEYVVRVKGLVSSLDSDFKEVPEPPSGVATGINGLRSAMHPIQTALRHHRGEGVETYLIKESADNALQLVTEATSLTLGRYFKLSEDYKNQNNLNNVMSNINKVKSFSGSILSGAAMGNAIVPGAGAVVGAVIGGATNVAKQVIEWEDKKANFASSMNATRVETSFRAKRAGLYDGGKGTEN